MSKKNFNRLICERVEGGGQSFSVDCPECGAEVHLHFIGRWGGREVSDDECYECGARIAIGGVVIEE